MFPLSPLLKESLKTALFLLLCPYPFPFPNPDPLESAFETVTLILYFLYLLVRLYPSWCPILPPLDAPFCPAEGMEALPPLLPYTFLYLTDQPYLKLFLDLLLILALCAILASVSYLLSLFISKDAEKASPYECGFAPFDSATRLPFDVHFYLVAILFLIFDVEIACIFPWALQLEEEEWWQIAVLYTFLLILTVGFLYEWRRGALVWAIRRKPAPAPQPIRGKSAPIPHLITPHFPPIPFSSPVR